MIRAESYEVLVVDIAAENDLARINEFEKDAAKLDALHGRGYTVARPYWNLLHMADGQVHFVFGELSYKRQMPKMTKLPKLPKINVFCPFKMIEFRNFSSF